MMRYNFVYANPTGETCFTHYNADNLDVAWDLWNAEHDTTADTVLMIFTGQVLEILYQE